MRFNALGPNLGKTSLPDSSPSENLRQQPPQRLLGGADPVRHLAGRTWEEKKSRIRTPLPDSPSWAFGIHLHVTCRETRKSALKLGDPQRCRCLPRGVSTSQWPFGPMGRLRLQTLDLLRGALPLTREAASSLLSAARPFLSEAAESHFSGSLKKLLTEEGIA